MKKSNSQIFNAVLITILACLVVFALALYIFGSEGFWTTKTPVTIPITSTTSGTLIIPIPIDTTGSVDSGATDGNIVTPPSTDTGTRVCTMEYAPVCGAISVQCITAPCPQVRQTFGNNCMADAAWATDITMGECSTTSTGTVYDTGSYLLYSNTRLDYWFAMPRYSHYAGLGARDGAVHSLAIATTASGVLDFATAPVQVWLYSRAPATPPSSQSVQLDAGVLYIRNNDTTGDVKISNIVETVMASAK